MTTDLALGKKRAGELGLILMLGGSAEQSGYTQYYYYSADDIHKLLAEARQVFQYKPGGMSGDWSHVIDEEFGGAKKYANQALVLGTRPIKQESRGEKMEKLLREATDGVTRTILHRQSWNERVKALLAEKGES